MPTSASRPRRKPTGAATFSPDVTEAIMLAAVEELAAKGFVGMSMEAVARRAGVGKSALYRRWSSKEEMTTQLFGRFVAGFTHVPDTGDLREDVAHLLSDLRDWLTDPRMARIYPDLLAEAQRNPTLAQAMTEQIAIPRRRMAQEVIDRAASRGELAGGVDHEMVIDLMGAGIFWRHVARRVPVTEAYVNELTDLLVGLLRGVR